MQAVPTAPQAAAPAQSARHTEGLVSGGAGDAEPLVQGMRVVLDPENPVSRRLWLGRSDGDLFADQVVEECRLADIGPTDNSDEP